MKNDSFCVSLTLNALLLSRSTFIPSSFHTVSLSADIESRTRQTKKNSKTGGYFTNSFQLACTIIFHTLLCREETCEDVDVLY